jgi:predicted dehydrogenase
LRTFTAEGYQANFKRIPGAARDPSWIGFGPDPNQAMLEEFIDSIRQNRDPAVTWNDGFQALRVALAAYESATNQAPVRP